MNKKGHFIFSISYQLPQKIKKQLITDITVTPVHKDTCE